MEMLLLLLLMMHNSKKISNTEEIALFVLMWVLFAVCWRKTKLTVFDSSIVCCGFLFGYGCLYIIKTLCLVGCAECWLRCWFFFRGRRIGRVTVFVVVVDGLRLNLVFWIFIESCFLASRISYVCILSVAFCPEFVLSFCSGLIKKQTCAKLIYISLYIYMCWIACFLTYSVFVYVFLLFACCFLFGLKFVHSESNSLLRPILWF